MDHWDYEFKEVKKSRPSYTIEEHEKILNNTPFPFFNSFRVCTPHNGWDEEFVDSFPDILDWSRSLPLVEGKKFTFGWLYQYPRDYLTNSKKPLCSPIHVDEIGGFGLRYYLENNDNNLFFYGTKTSIKDVKDIDNPDVPTHKKTHKFVKEEMQFTEQDYPVPCDYFFNKAVRINTRKNTSFLLGQEKAAHFIMHEQQPKFTFIVQPVGKLEHRYDLAQIDKNIQATLLERADEFIWYDNLVT
jgi:hypothetical protein